MFRAFLRHCFPIAAIALACSPAKANDSAYTRHVWEKCPSIGADGSDGVVVRRCAGRAGIAVVWTAGDNSSSVSFGVRPMDEELNIGSFFEVGSTIEWRGAAGGRPVAAIVRYAVGQRIGRLDGSRLVVYRLQPDGASCIIGSVDGRARNANVQARAIVDTRAAEFVCGRTPRQ